MSLLSLLEASQAAVESSDQALRVAEEANTQAKKVLKAVTEALVKEDRKKQQQQLVSTNFDTNKNLVNDIDNDANTEDEESTSHIYLLVSSTGSAANHQSDMLGLYRKTEEMRDGRSVYIQEHDTKYGGSSHRKLSSAQGVWRITRNGSVWLRAATPSESPTSVKWQYDEDYKQTWRDDQTLTVTGLSEKPSQCEVTISLSHDVKRDIWVPEVAGVYRADGSYCNGRPVLRHSEGSFTLSAGGNWRVSPRVGGGQYLYSRSAPSQCVADPSAARNEREGVTHWKYWSKQGEFPESKRIIIKCNKCNH